MCPGLWIVGLGGQYPPYILRPDDLDGLAARFYNSNSPGLNKLLQINKRTGIESRPAISTYEDGFGSRTEHPTISEHDEFFRQAGVNLTVQACEKALRQWGGSREDITHTIGVTCTNQGNPGYDFLVIRKLGLSLEVDRVLLHGVGCAGGLSIMRIAAQIAAGATARDKPARILAFACELCTLNVRSELVAAAEKSNTADSGIAAALFSDAAAAFVLCNDLGCDQDTQPILQVVEWGTATLPYTAEHMSFYVDPLGFRTVLSREIPNYTKKAVKPIFEKLLPGYTRVVAEEGVMTQDNFDWALHPGGHAIIEGVKDVMGLTEHQLRASREIYRTRGNSSSPSVLIVLEMLLTMGRGSDHVVATSFGPGLAIEMVLLKRCRGDEKK